ncbi:hypothetical protein SCUCBS95973_007420 [Sporothrix curviconia]|uniref:DUF6594 domain-containing protein n=1 Tax=Sporothrix curviconia TaxID=1260050 RepID=A0ABP0CFX6_9PEZI
MDIVECIDCVNIKSAVAEAIQKTMDVIALLPGVKPYDNLGNLFGAYLGRVAVAFVGAAFLIGPMWLMMLRNTLYTGLIWTTVFVSVFGILSAYWVVDYTSVLSATAAYAAVLVVFVGLTTPS